MAVNIQYFTPDVSTGTSAGAASAAVVLPNAADALLYLVNLGPNTISFKLGTTNAVTVTTSTGCALLPGQGLIVGAQGMSYIAMIAHGCVGMGSTINLTSGN
jgi:hypothetical protein